MRTRPEIGLLTCLGLIALLTLGVLANAPLLLTLCLGALYCLLAIFLNRFSSARALKAEAQFDRSRRSMRHLDSWINVIDALPVAAPHKLSSWLSHGESIGARPSGLFNPYVSN